MMKNMTLEITTPAVLFPTVSLLLLAYTNRFFGTYSNCKTNGLEW
ncbi:DUF2721 domain-containing protein [Leptotrichia hofstadii]